MHESEIVDNYSICLIKFGLKAPMKMTLKIGKWKKGRATLSGQKKFVYHISILLSCTISLLFFKSGAFFSLRVYFKNPRILLSFILTILSRWLSDGKLREINIMLILAFCKIFVAVKWN